MQSVTMIECTYKEIEQLARGHYGLTDYNFVEAECCGNDTYHCFRTHGELFGTDPAAWEVVRATKSIKNVPEFCNGLLIDALCRDGHIAAGTYLVAVSW